MMRTFVIVVQMGLIIATLVAVVGLFFNGLVWLSLIVSSYFPIIGKRHRHDRWDQLTQESGRAKSEPD